MASAALRVWVTRTEPGAAGTAARLRSMGLAPVVAPLLRVRPLPFAADLQGVAALAFTSANGVTAFAAEAGAPDLPVFVVGKGTAAAARAAGFGDVRSADGDIHDLVALVRRHAAELEGDLLRPGAAQPAGDLVAALSPYGVRVRSEPVYEALPTEMDERTAELLGTGVRGVGAVLIHSPRAGRRLAALAGGGPRRGPLAACISAAAAEPLRAAGFGRLVVAGRPNEDALLGALASALSGQTR